LARLLILLGPSLACLGNLSVPAFLLCRGTNLANCREPVGTCFLLALLRRRLSSRIRLNHHISPLFGSCTTSARSLSVSTMACCTAMRRSASCAFMRPSRAACANTDLRQTSSRLASRTISSIVIPDIGFAVGGAEHDVRRAAVLVGQARADVSQNATARGKGEFQQLLAHGIYRLNFVVGDFPHVIVSPVVAVSVRQSPRGAAPRRAAGPARHAGWSASPRWCAAS